MIDQMGDTDVDLLILPVVTTTLVLVQAIGACVNWFKRHARFMTGSVAPRASG